MYLKMISDSYGNIEILLLKGDDGLVKDISSYPNVINEDENVIINGVEYELGIFDWDINNSPHWHEYKLVKCKPTISHDLTDYLI